jgi:hypothetical protein
VTALVLDAGALIALDRNVRDVWAMLRVSTDDHELVVVPAGAIAQAWRGGPRQAVLSRALRHCDELALDGTGARAAGLLCGESDTADVIDASVAIAAAGMARHHEVAILTSDPDDLTHLIDTLDIRASVIRG